MDGREGGRVGLGEGREETKRGREGKGTYRRHQRPPSRLHPPAGVEGVSPTPLTAPVCIEGAFFISNHAPFPIFLPPSPSPVLPLFRTCMFFTKDSHPFRASSRASSLSSLSAPYSRVSFSDRRSSSVLCYGREGGREGGEVRETSK